MTLAVYLLQQLILATIFFYFTCHGNEEFELFRLRKKGKKKVIANVAKRAGTSLKIMGVPIISLKRTGNTNYTTVAVLQNSVYRTFTPCSLNFSRMKLILFSTSDFSSDIAIY